MCQLPPSFNFLIIVACWLFCEITFFLVKVICFGVVTSSEQLFLPQAHVTSTETDQIPSVGRGC